MAASNNEQSSSLSSCAPDFISFGDLTGPGAPGVPAPVDSIARLGVALMQFILPVEKELTLRFRVDNQMFITARGDCISRPPRRRPQQGRIGGPYPRPDEVGEQLVCGFK